MDCTRCGVFKIDDFAEGILRDHPKTLEQIANISGYIRENSRMVINQDLTDFLFKLPTPSLEEKTIRLFQWIARRFPRPGNNFCINHWGADMVLEKILDGKEETFDEKFIAMFQDILPWLSYGWIVDGAELAYVVRRTLQDNLGFLEDGLPNGYLCITPAGWSFLDRVEKSTIPKPATGIQQRSGDSTDVKAALPSDVNLPHGTVTIMFTDIVGSTKLKGEMPGGTSSQRDEAFWIKIKKPHDDIVKEQIRLHGGRIFNSTGDGFCAHFPDAEEAVFCAVDIQEQIQAHAISTPSGPLLVRIGLHTGYANTMQEDICASHADKASRVQASAEGGQVLLSNETYVLVRNHLKGVFFTSKGVIELKGIGPEELFIASRNEAPPKQGTEKPLNQPESAHNLDLSEQAVSILRQFVESGGTDLFYMDLGGGQFVLQIENIAQVGVTEPRFIKGDLDQLVDHCLLTVEYNSNGDPIYGITRSGARFVEGTKRTEI